MLYNSQLVEEYGNLSNKHLECQGIFAAPQDAPVGGGPETRNPVLDLVFPEEEPELERFRESTVMKPIDRTVLDHYEQDSIGLQPFNGRRWMEL